MIKKYTDFLNEEASIVGNPGIPGETPGGRRKGQYLTDLEREAKAKYGVPQRPTPMDAGRHGMEIMMLVQEVTSMIEGHKEELEQLATEIILQEYGEILDGVELDIKFADGQEIRENLEDSDDEKDDTKFKEIEDERVINLIHKAKLQNVIIQGEAKNTKRIMDMPEVKDRVIEIFGEEEGEEIYSKWQRITELANKMDWIIPIEHKADMMENDISGQGFAGSVNVQWKPKDEEENQEEAPEVAEQPEQPEQQEEQEENEIFEDYNPVIKARGIDFPMLLHEAVKGIYELIAAAGIPTNDEEAMKVKMNVSGFHDEAEDFVYGPEIAGKLRDFVYECKGSDYHKNIREFVFGRMVRIEDPTEFLDLFKGILNNTPEAKRTIESMIVDIIDELKKYELGEALPSERGDDDEEEEDIYGSSFELPKRQDDPYVSSTPKEVKKNYDEMSVSEIQEEIEKAVSDENYELAAELTNKYLKGESKRVWDMELNRINESLKYKKRLKK